MSIQAPDKVYVVIGHDEVSADGSLVATEYLHRRYGEDDYGFISGEGERVLFFYDEGHRDEFHAKFGGFKGMGRKTSGLPGQSLVKVAN